MLDLFLPIMYFMCVSCKYCAHKSAWTIQPLGWRQLTIGLPASDWEALLAHCFFHLLALLVVYCQSPVSH